MNSLTKYLVESMLLEEEASITVLLPGGFKPPHGGHLDLAKRYKQSSNVGKVIILIGPKEREGFTREQSVKVWKALIGATSGIEVQPVAEDNPLLAAYKFIETAKPGTYATAASSKGEDYARVKNFVLGHSKGGKYARKGVKVIELPLNVKPLVYSGRTDRLNRKGISASVLRKDVADGNYKNFKTNYPGLNDALTKILFRVLSKNSTSTTLTEKILLSGTVLFDESFQNSWYGKQLLLCGGAAGHLIHPYEDLDLSFADIKNMIDTTLSGDLKFVQEKLDGQNLMVTWKDGQLRAARNKGQIKNFGENSLTTDQVKTMFHGRGSIQIAFVECMNDLSSAIERLSPKQKQNFFENGKRFISLEVLFPDTANVIPYGASQLRLHHFKIYDESGNIIGEDTDGIKALQTAFDQLQVAQQKTFQVKTTDPAKLKHDLDYDAQQTYFTNLLDKIKNTYNLKDSDTVKDYNKKWWTAYITKQAQTYSAKVGKNLMQLLLVRWADSNKEARISAILGAIKNEDFKNWVYDFDQTDLADQKKVALKPVEELFLELGVRTLKNIENLVTTNPDESVQKIKTELDASIDKIKDAAKTGKIADKDKAMKFLRVQLERLQKMGGYGAIVPTEGIVFKYNNKLYKLTGAFAPINQIIGYLRF